jgi:hypothetical protein
MSDFKCDSCGEMKPNSERARVSTLARVLFLATNVVLAGTITWSSDLCERCVRQRYLLSGLVVLGVLVLVSLFM